MTKKIELAPHVNDITRALKDKIGLEQIERELKEYTDVYQLPLFEAKRNIVKKYGGDMSLLRAGDAKQVHEITIKDKFVDVVGLVRSIRSKEATIKGENRVLFYGLLMGQDGSSIAFTAWDDPKIEKGQLVKVNNSRISSWRDRPQLNINGPHQISLLKLENHPEYDPQNIRNEASISELSAGDSFIALKGLVIFVEKRTKERDDGSILTFFSGTFGDETGTIPFTSWKEEESLQEGDFLLVENAYAREWRGQPQLVFNASSSIRKTERPEGFPGPEELMKPKSMSLMDLEKQGGGNNVITSGVLLDIKKNSGLIMRCPDCGRVVQEGASLLHGETDGKPDLRVKGVFDDGISSISIVLGKDLTEKLLGMSLDECQELARKKMDPSVIQKKVEEKLLTRSFNLHGNVMRDDYGLTMIVREAEPTQLNVMEQAEELLMEMEGGQ